MTERMGTLSFPLRAGMLIRGRVRREVKEYCWQRGYTLDIDEEKGVFGSWFLFRVTAPSDRISEAHKDLFGYFAQFGEGE